MEHNLISIVLPVYNAEHYVKDTIESIINQSYLNWELIVIDDGSIDRSADIISNYSSFDKRIKLYRQKNMGLAKTLNKGISLAKSNYIARIDADDICKENRLTLQIRELVDNEDVVLVCSNVEYIDSGNNTLGFSFSSTSTRKLKKKLEFGNVFFHPTVMFKKDIALKVGGYDERLGKYFEDYMLWVKMLEFGNVSFLPNHLVKYRIHGDSISSNTPVQIKNFMRKYYNLGYLDDVDYEAISSLELYKNVNNDEKRSVSILGKFRVTSYLISVLRGVFHI